VTFNDVNNLSNTDDGTTNNLLFIRWFDAAGQLCLLVESEASMNSYRAT
jgi:hypothetical protein